MNFGREPNAHVLYAICFALLAGAGTLHAQTSPTMTCFANAGVPPVLRAEGLTELIGDVTLQCSQGIPTAVGVAVPTATITLYASTNVTNRKTAGFVDALLIADEPHSPSNPTVPLLACGAPGSDDGGTGYCSVILGDGTGRNTYNGTPGHPNVFHGILDYPNKIIFPNVPIDPPGTTGTRVFRITNLRVNAFELGVVANPVPSQVTLNINVSSSASILIVNPGVTVGIVAPGLSTVGGNAATLRQCVTANGTIATDPTKSLDTGGQNGAQYSIKLANANQWYTRFQPKNVAQSLADAPSKGTFPTSYPADLNQNLPGNIFNTETGFLNGPLSDPPSQTVPPTAAFPSAWGLDKAGAADQGTRVYISFENVPASVKLFVPVVVPLISSTNEQRSGTAVLVSTDANGAGAYSPIAGNASGLAQIPSTGSTAMAVYEVLYADPVSLESLTIPVAAAYVVNGRNDWIAAGPIAVKTGFAPVSRAWDPDSTSPVPRFGDTTFLGFSATGFNVQTCGAPDLTISATHSGDFTQGSTTGAITLTVNNTGDQPTSGTVSVTDTLPSGLSATSMTGTGWACTLANLTCSRSDTLANGGRYPVISIAVTVAANAPAAVANAVSVSGGGENDTANNSASDAINVVPAHAVTVGTSPPRLLFRVDGAIYSSTQVFTWTVGSQHTISVDSPQTILTGSTQYVFNTWSDSGAMTHTITVGSLPATYTATFGTADSAIQCITNAGVPPLIPAEALASYAGDVTLQCTGGTPAATDTSLPQVDIRMTLNTDVASRLTSTGFTEALLIIDEPHSASNPMIPLTPCGASGSNDDGTGVCSITSNGSGAAYDGSSGHPNVFQGRLESANTILWKSIPINAPGASGVRTLRFTNVRVNGNELGVSQTQMPTQVTAQFSVTPGGVAITNAQVTVGIVEQAFYRPANTAATLSQCTSANSAIATDPTSTLSAGGQNGAQFTVNLHEGYATAWLPKNLAQEIANGASNPAAGANGVLYSYISGSHSYGTGDYNQNVPGSIYNTATGFMNGGMLAPPNSPLGAPSAVAFSSLRGLNAAGAADHGTRLYLKFAAIPAGMKLFVPVNLPLMDTPYNRQSGVAILTVADASGVGPYSAIPGNSAGLAPLTVTNGTAIAVYEIVFADPTVLESVSIPVAAAYVANQAPNQPAVGTITVETEMAPLSTVGMASDSTVPHPRFAATDTTHSAFNIQACPLPDLAVALTHTGNFTRGDTGKTYNITVTNSGSTATSGTVTATDVLPSGLTATAMSGNGWTCTLSSLTCTRSDALAGSASYPAITLTVNVASNAPALLTNTVSVSGGGESVTSNNSASDPTTILPPPGTVVSTSPAGLAFMVDGTTYLSSQTFQWPIGSTHTIAVTTPQNSGAPTRNVFANWSDGGAVSHTITAASLATAYTATFTSEYLLTLLSSPADGGSFAPNSGNYYAPNAPVAIQAIPNAGYFFSQWLGSVTTTSTPSTTVIMSGPQTVTAIFSHPLQSQSISFAPLADRTFGDPPFQIFASSSSGLPVRFTVDSGPATISGNLVTLTGTGIVTIRASQDGNASYAVAADVRQSFKVNAATTRPTLTLTAMPANGGTVTASPAATNGGYTAGSSVQITATANAGYVFAGFSGDLGGITNPQSLVMSANRSVSANFAALSNSPTDHLTFGAASGGSAPESQTIPIDSSGGTPTVQVNTASGGNWLTATLVAGNLSSIAKAVGATAVRIAVDSTLTQKLPSGAYTGYVIIQTGAVTRVITASLLIDTVRLDSVVNAASYVAQPITSNDFFTVRGVNLATQTAVAETIALTQSLAGTMVTVKDSAGLVQRALLQYVSPTQVNFVAPAGLAPGVATLTLNNSSGHVSSTSVQVAKVAPGLFAADATGSGLAAATVLRVGADGTRYNSLVADCSSGSCTAVPIDLGESGDTVVVSLFGTGICGRSSLDAVQADFGGIVVPVSYAGVQSQYPGLDQVNVTVPRALVGRGQVPVKLTVDGQLSNALKIVVK